MIRSYTELMKLTSFEDRFLYLKLNSSVGIETFGFDRIFNQRFYNSTEWRNFRNHIITRDSGCDLAHPNHPILGSKIIIHHLNPITLEDLNNRTEFLMNPEFVITTILSTHNQIHYGEELIPEVVVRTKNDTCPWKKD